MNNTLNKPTEKILHLYLWSIHGLNISSVHNYYPIETEFKSLVFYSKPFNTIYTEKVNELIKNPCSMITGSCPIIPITDSETKTKFAYLPPVVFGIKTTDLAIDSGLKYFKLEKIGFDKKNGKDVCKTVSEEDVHSPEDLIRLFGNNNGDPNAARFTYSSLFAMVVENCKKKRINPNDVVLGIFSCQGKSEYFSNKYDETNIQDLVPRRVDSVLLKSDILHLFSFKTPILNEIAYK
jgi:hypothetical protein